MAWFRIKFLKTVTNDYGNSVEICQRELGITAVNRDSARKAAVRRFCTLEKIPNWRFRADRIDVAAADFPS